MRTMQNLMGANTDRKLGNHRLEIDVIGVRKYYYYRTIICTEYPKSNAFRINDSYGTQSTHRACASYRRRFLDKGYHEAIQCPTINCNNDLDTDEAMNALSREDNETMICTQCGTKEALQGI